MKRRSTSLTNINHHGNANQNHSELPLIHTPQTGHVKNTHVHTQKVCVGKDVGKWKLSYIASRGVKRFSHRGKQVASKKSNTELPYN